MIPVSLVVVVVGGWTAVYLADLVLKVRASGLRPQPVESRAGAHGPVLPKVFSLLLPSFLGGWNPLRPWCLRALFRVAHRSGGVNKVEQVAGGVWRPVPPSHCGRWVPAAFGSFPGGVWRAWEARLEGGKKLKHPHKKMHGFPSLC